jgi:hypothetical protein
MVEKLTKDPEMEPLVEKLHILTNNSSLVLVRT